MRVPPEHVLERQHLEPHALDLLDPLHPGHDDAVAVQAIEAGHLLLRLLLLERRANPFGVDSGVPIGDDRRLAPVYDLHETGLHQHKHKNKHKGT